MTYAERYPSEPWAREIEKEIRTYLKSVLPGATVKVLANPYKFKIVLTYNDMLYANDVTVAEVEEAKWFDSADDNALVRKVQELVRFTIDKAYEVP